MGRLRCAALSVLALTVICPATFAAEPAPATASDGPVQTGSIGGADAAIGAAARKLIEPAPVVDGAHLLPAETVSTGADAQPAAAPPKPTPEELDRTALSTFYQSRGDQPLWVTSDGFTTKGRLALAELSRAGSVGT